MRKISKVNTKKATVVLTAIDNKIDTILGQTYRLWSFNQRRDHKNQGLAFLAKRGTARG